MEQLHQTVRDKVRRRADLIREINDQAAYLEFERKSGKRYRHIGREVGPWPDFFTWDYVKSLESGEIKKMTEEQFLKFKKT